MSSATRRWRANEIQRQFRESMKDLSTEFLMDMAKAIEDADSQGFSPQNSLADIGKGPPEKFARVAALFVKATQVACVMECERRMGETEALLN